MPSSRPWVAITATEDFPVSMEPVHASLDGVAPIKTIPLPFSPIDEDEEVKFATMLEGAAGMLLRPGYITPSFLDKLPDLKVVAVHGAGVDQVDVAACTQRGVLVTNAPGANADAVAELTLCLMVDLARRVSESAARVQRERVWGEARHTGSELKGKTLGLVGIGQIGGRVTRIAKAFGMEVCAHDPGLDNAAISALGAQAMTLKELLGASDFISLHAPHIPATHHMINPDAFAAMKPGAFLINAARGPLIDETALAAALKSGRLGGAALDVLEGEPPNPDSPIFDAPNILLTPHIGGSTVECLDTIAATASADIARFIQGEAVLHPVNTLA
jgi:D-3-phosphoglycerate dehydrogenase / 2-oxoglutarate reductase